MFLFISGWIFFTQGSRKCLDLSNMPRQKTMIFRFSKLHILVYYSVYFYYIHFSCYQLFHFMNIWSYEPFSGIHLEIPSVHKYWLTDFPLPIKKFAYFTLRNFLPCVSQHLLISELKKFSLGNQKTYPLINSLQALFWSISKLYVRRHKWGAFDSCYN